MTDNLDNLRSIEGFPKGKDEDLLALSNPPYYTTYPNPHIEDFIQQYGTPYDEDTDDYHCEPFVSDVSEGKNDPIYNAHTYHTKVPFRAIIPFIEHYTKPGDIVFDGFCGTGMTGIAAQFIGREAILGDLSPIASFIAYNYNLPINIESFRTEATRILKTVEAECGWMYETLHSDGTKGRINFVAWSDVFLCPYCSKEIVFWNAAVDPESGKVDEIFKCQFCGSTLSKRQMDHAIDEIFDNALNKSIQKYKQIPVLINYSVRRKNYEKKPDERDLQIIQKIMKSQIPYWFPIDRMPDGDEARRNDIAGITHIHHFYTERTLWILASIFNHIQNDDIMDIRIKHYLKLWFTSQLINLSKMNRFRRVSFPYNPLSGTLYISSLTSEADVFRAYMNKLDKFIAAKSSEYKLSKENARITIQSTTDLSQIPINSIDYIFTDPPFGGNLMYSELSFLWEVWLRILTNIKPEAIVNKTQKKDLDGYRSLMTECFSEMYRVLKPGRWITVEFHNSKASVWNALQDALSRAGFVVAQVTVLDKQQGSFKQVTSAGAVKNDLIINAYKPQAVFSKRLISRAGRGLESDFIREHLRQLPIAANVERSKEMLFSKYLAYYVQHGYQVMYNGEQFYQALSQWGLLERDGYWLADETQANEYEKRKAKTFGKGGIQAQAVLFVSDERSARQWIWNFLDEPKSYDEIYTDFLKALQTSEDEIPEVKTILEESFVRTNGHWKRPDQLTQAELERKRQERLLRQFEEYLNTAKANQKLKEVRLEAVIAGFTECYRSGRYKDILLVGKKLAKGILENSSDLYDFIDIAEAKVEG